MFLFVASTEVEAVSCTKDTSQGCLGSLLPGVTAYIRNIETGARMKAGEVGEIMVKTGTMMKGYLNDDARTMASYDDEGFYGMGDMGYYDDQGMLYFKDRLKDMIKINDKCVAPLDIEEAIENIPGVVEACVWVRLYCILYLYHVHNPFCVTSTSGN